jgi:uncharacterized membrane protein YcaP (DUF421 family)
MDIMDLLKVIGRIYTILPLMLFVTLMMGKRSIGELPVFDLLVIIVLGSVVGADIAEPKVNHIYTLIAVIAIGILQIIVSTIKIHNRKIGRFLTFEPTIVIHNGQFLVHNMKKLKYSIDNVLQMLREKNVFNVKDVELAIVEASGNLSVKLIQPKEPAKVENIHSIVKDTGIEIPIIIDGTIYPHILQAYDLDEAWLKEQLRTRNISDYKNVFYASINQSGELHISIKHETQTYNGPIILH